MRSVRPRRRAFLDVRRITIGDYIVLFSALFTVISLFLPWFTVAGTTLGGRNPSAFTYSQVAAVIVIVFFLATLFLVIYPRLSPDLGAPPLPFSTPIVFLLMGLILLLLFVYEAGKYDCIVCSSLGVGRGYGIWFGLVASLLFIVGSVIKWGSRDTRQRYS